MNDGGRRGSAEAWLDAAYDALIEGGVDTVRILPLGEKLGLSRTSFYWFFADREALLTGLLGRWRAHNTGGLVGRCEAYAETIGEAVFNVFDCWLDGRLFDSRLEYAVRAWALRSPEVAAEIATADAVRIDALAAMFRRFGFTAAAADVRARTVYLTQIGYITTRTEETTDLRLTRVADYAEVFCGRPAEPRELDRFLARHRNGA